MLNLINSNVVIVISSIVMYSIIQFLNVVSRIDAMINLLFIIIVVVCLLLFILSRNNPPMSIQICIKMVHVLFGSV